VRRAVPFEEQSVGRTFEHHWGRTIQAAEATAFATQILAFHPPYFNEQRARSIGLPSIVVHPMLVFTTVFGLSVEDLSESGGANLSVAGLRFSKDVFPGDTLYARSTVLEARRSKSRPGQGIVTWETVGSDQAGLEVVRYQRTNIVTEGHPEGSVPPMTGYARDFATGMRMRHSRSRTITDLDLNGLALAVMNTASGHFSDAAMSGTAFGQRINFGGLTLSLVIGLATQDTSGQLVREVGLDDVMFTKPVKAGDTIFAATEVLSVEAADENVATVRLRHVGYNQHNQIVCEATRSLSVLNGPPRHDA
jgi:acyl dehydratase